MKEHIFHKYSDSLREWFKLLLKIMDYIFYVDTSSSIWVYWYRQNSSRSMACLIGRCQSWRAKHHSFGFWYKFVSWGLYKSFALCFAHFFRWSSRYEIVVRYNHCAILMFGSLRHQYIFSFFSLFISFLLFCFFSFDFVTTGSISPSAWVLTMGTVSARTDPNR